MGPLPTLPLVLSFGQAAWDPAALWYTSPLTMSLETTFPFLSLVVQAPHLRHGVLQVQSSSETCWKKFQSLEHLGFLDWGSSTFVALDYSSCSNREYTKLSRTGWPGVEKRDGEAALL